MSRTICLYLHVHQPYRVKNYSVFHATYDHDYFNESSPHLDTNNQAIIDKVSEKSYLPTNRVLHKLLQDYDDFKISLSITGTLIEQLKTWRPDVLDSFKKLISTGKVEILAETYYHSLAFFYSKNEFEEQVKIHSDLIEAEFGVRPTAFRNTELSYNNQLAKWADKKGYQAIITEGWDEMLGWQSPNYVYKPKGTNNIKLLLKNYKLSDDVAFRFSDRKWSDWPLDSSKFVHWIDAIPTEQSIINLFMDYETFGEHQWDDTGIFNFLETFPGVFLRNNPGGGFATITEAANSIAPVGEIDCQRTVTWADTERDLTAWLGNAMQQNAIQEIYALEQQVKNTKNLSIIDSWRKLQTSDHFYYMCTKWFNDGDVHAYFSPYDSPYNAFIYYMNTLHDLKTRLIEEGQEI